MIIKLRKFPLVIICSVSISCAPPLEDECFSELMDQWEASVLVEKDGKQFRLISSGNLNSVLDQQYYPNTPAGKTLFESHAWSKCTKN